MPGARWFRAARSTTRNTRWPRPAHGSVALVSLSQTRDRTALTYDELADDVRRCAAGLRRLGIGPGDRVVGLLPNITETIVAFLATASIGAIWSSCAPEFGTSAILDRWRQLDPASSSPSTDTGTAPAPCRAPTASPPCRRPAVDPPRRRRWSIWRSVPDPDGVSVAPWSDLRAEWDR